jgi:hypothetical protein
MTNIISDFNGFDFSDGKILSYKLGSGILTMKFVNWEERKSTIKFLGVLAVFDLGIVGRDLSEGGIKNNDPWLSTALSQHSDEDPNQYSCFLFFSRWSEVPDFKVVAQFFSAVIEN